MFLLSLILKILLLQCMWLLFIFFLFFSDSLVLLCFSYQTIFFKIGKTWLFLAFLTMFLNINSVLFLLLSFLFIVLTCQSVYKFQLLKVGCILVFSSSSRTTPAQALAASILWHFWWSLCCHLVFCLSSLR